MNGLDLKSRPDAEIDNRFTEKRQSSQPEKWLDTYGDYLYNYAIQKLRNSAHAEDVVQETLLSALMSTENNTGYSGKATEKTWLTGILNHKIIDLIRKEIRESTTDDIVALSDSNTENEIDNLFDSRGKWITPQQNWGDPEKLLNDQRFLKIINLCLSKLNPIMSQLFRLKELSGQNSKEICKELNISTTNYSVILYRARMHLRCCIEKNWSK
jgi:RNA polymerase sigma-70 factor (ECF subfamily)